MKRANGSGTVVYQWRAWQGFLAPHIFQGAHVLTARVEDSLERILFWVPPDCRFFVFSLNCSVTARFPLVRSELLETLRNRGVRVVNGQLGDTSKLSLHRVLTSAGLPTLSVGPEAGPDEQVVVKTDLNFGGAGERSLSPHERSLLGIGSLSGEIADGFQYVFCPAAEVRPEWWSDPALIIQRSVTNRLGAWYRAYFLLGRMIVTRLISPHKLKKGSNSEIDRVWKVALSPPAAANEAGETDCPAALVAMARKVAALVSLDYGAIDLLRDDEMRFFVVDINPTPYFDEPIPELLNHLAGYELRSAFAPGSLEPA